MQINYKLGSDIFKYSSLDEIDLTNLNFVLTNSKGDFLNLGVSSNSCKYQGFNVCKPETIEIFKFIENIVPTGVEVESVDYLGYKIIRKFKSEFEYSSESSVYTEDPIPEDLAQAQVSSNFFSKEKIQTYDSFFIGPNGGLVYDIKNFEGSLFVDLDMRKKNDFSKSGRNYKVYKEGENVFVEYSKSIKGKGVSYRMFIAIKAVNFAYDLVEKFVTKEYEYSRLQKSSWKWDIFRLMDVKVLNNKKLIFGCGFTKNEALKQAEELFTQGDDFEMFSKLEWDSIFSTPTHFAKPLTHNVSVAYDLSRSACYKFLNLDLKDTKVGAGCFTGIPYFSNVWSKDDIFALKSFIDQGEFILVRDRINFYLRNIDSKTGSLKNLLSRDDNTSCDVLFLLSLRIRDFIFHLTELGILNEIYSKKDLEKMHYVLNVAFNRVIKYNWDFDEELIRVKNKDSSRDSMYCAFPLNVQILFTRFVSFMGYLSNYCSMKKEAIKFLDFESLLVQKIRQAYFRNGLLYDNLTNDKVSSNVFLSYYFYPNMFDNSDWEDIFDRSLGLLLTNWEGGVSSLSKIDPQFVSEHSGGDRYSRSRGDSFYFLNNVCAIVLNDLDEYKYREVVSKILVSSTRDILVCGTIGFASELSSSFMQKSEGNLAQLTSSSSYVELVDNLFGKKY